VARPNYLFSRFEVDSVNSLTFCGTAGAVPFVQRRFSRFEGRSSGAKEGVRELEEEHKRWVAHSSLLWLEWATTNPDVLCF
jgi:hypothetical protein